MSDLALQRIAENKKTKNPYLDLGNCGLTELPDELFHLTWLKSLNVGNSWWNWDDNSRIYSNNRGLPNHISSLPKNLYKLVNLEKFLNAGLPDENLELSDLEPISTLTGLKYLDFAWNKVENLNPLKELISLEFLDFGGNYVKDLKPLEGLTKLKNLFFGSNKVQDISSLSNLISLRKLIFWDNQVSDLRPLEKLNFLRVLEFDDNQVSNLAPLIKKIDSGLMFSWTNNPLIHPPIEVARIGNEAILNYFAQIEAQGGTEEILEAKMLIVGEGKTGKTTLFEKMKDPAFDPLKNQTDETHGINIHEGLEIKHKSLGEQVFRANLWDFGGQELQYMTHQFFLTPRALYVLMMDARAEAPNLPYWFKIISLLGKEREDSPEKVPLLLVFNKRKDGTGKLPQYQDILQYYEEHLDPCFLEVDFAENDYRFENLMKAIEERLVNLPIVRSKLPRQWKPIREALREESKKRPYVSFERFGEICSEHKVTKEDDQLNLSGYLHQLGSILHFQNDPSLLDLVVLSPQWAVEGVYCFLKNEKIAKQGGRFTPDDIFQILKGEDYSRSDAQKVLKLMTKNNFDICYESSEGNYVAAQLLPDNAPPYIWHKKNGALQFRYQYPIMPKGLMSRLIVRLSDFIERDEKGVELVWKKGAILRYKVEGEECRVLMREDDAESQSGLRQIILEVMGEPRYRKFALRRVRDEVDELHRRWFRSIHADEMVPCCCEGFCKNADQPYLHKLDKLLNLKFNRKIAKAQCGESGEDVPIELMLEGIYDRKEIGVFSQREKMRQ